MLVTRMTYNRVNKELADALAAMFTYKAAYERMAAQWNDICDKVNAKGGEDFLERGVLHPFDKEELTKLISLCHPDKHNGKQMATEMTQKLLKLKESLK